MAKGKRMAKEILHNQNNEYKFQDLYTVVQVESVAYALIEAFKANDMILIQNFLNIFKGQFDLMKRVMDQYEID